MTVANLIKLLKKQNQDDIVILASDAEGNSYSPAEDIGTDVVWDEENQEVGDAGDFEGKPALILYPI